MILVAGAWRESCRGESILLVTNDLTLTAVLEVSSMLIHCEIAACLLSGHMWAPSVYQTCSCGYLSTSVESDLNCGLPIYTQRPGEVLRRTDHTLLLYC